MKRPMTLGLCLGLAAAAGAAPVPAAEDARALAGQLTVLLRNEEQLAGYRDQCLRSQDAMSPEVLVAKSPDYFGGLRPGHERWRRVMAAYKLYAQQVCARPTREEWRELMISSYASAMSVAQLKGAIQYFSTPAGQAMAQAFQKTSEAMTVMANGIAQAHITRASVQYQGELARIVRGP